MKNYEIISMYDLQLFADGGAADGAAAGTGAGGTGVTASAAGVQTGVKGNQQTGNPASDGAPAAEVQNPTVQPTAADLNAEFDALIKGKFKDQYNARVKDTVQKRLRGPTEAAEKYKTLTPAMELLARRYGIQDVADAKALGQAILRDDALIEDAAMEKNMDAPQYREKILNEMELKELRRQEAGRRQTEAWKQQADAAKMVYPGLDLAVELQNSKFVELLHSNIDVRTAYEVIHKDDIISGAMRTAAQTAAQKVANSVAANGARPSENGSGQGAATVKIDVSKMTKAQRQDCIRRAMMGEKVTF